MLLAAAAGVKFLHVPYRGAAPALTDLLGGQVQVVALDMPVVISQIQAGNLVPIGIAGDKRDAILPDVPTLAEQGYPNTDASNWYALLAPAKTPAAVIAKLNKAVDAALADPPCTTSWSSPARRRSAARRNARHLHEGPVREMGPGDKGERHQDAGIRAAQPGRYSPVRGSRRKVGSLLRSMGSAASGADAVEFGVDAMHFLDAPARKRRHTHQPKRHRD